jgi:PEP-CTERM motif
MKFRYWKYVELGPRLSVELPFALNGDLTTVSAIPEPETYLMMLFGGLAAAAAARKRRAETK